MALPLPEVLHRDDQLIVVNKPSGVSVHRGWDNDRDVMMARVRNAIGQWVHPVHRLDRATSGAVLFALDKSSAAQLQSQFESGTIQKRYIAFVRGIVPPQGTIDHALAPEKGAVKRPAVTDYRRLQTFERYSLVEALPRTGRLHQIRRHFKHISHPLIGDVRYGKGEHNRLFRARFGLNRLALHARAIEFDHPTSGRRIRCLAALPDDLAGPWTAMGFALDA